MHNALTLRKLTFGPEKGHSPKVSVLLPARNEEKDLGRCLDSLVNQDYPDYEIIVIDDNSTDRTGEIMRSYAARYPKIKVLTGKPLADGWLGKPYACTQLAENADAEYLLFTDADTVHSRTSVSWAVTNMARHDADFLSAYVRHTIGSIGEAVLVPIVYLLTTFLIPLSLVPERNNPLLSFAIGQFIMVRKKVLESIGGFASVRNSIVEDMDLARAVKSSGFKTVFTDAKDYVSCRMYDSYWDACNGLSRVIFSAIYGSKLLLAGLVILICGVIELPVLALLLGLYDGGGGLAGKALIPALLFAGAWCVTLYDRRMPLYLLFLYPVLFAHIVVIAIVSFLKTGYGTGVEWKGRYVRYAVKKSIEGEDEDREL